MCQGEPIKDFRWRKIVVSEWSNVCQLRGRGQFNDRTPINVESTS